MAAQYGSFTYVDTLVPAPLTPFLTVFGVASGVAILVAAVFPQRARTLARAVVLVLAVALALVATGWLTTVTAAVWGLGFGAVPALFQSLALRSAPPAAIRATSAASAVAFQVGILAGSAIGGVLPTGPVAAVSAGVCVAVAIILGPVTAAPARR